MKKSPDTTNKPSATADSSSKAAPVSPPPSSNAQTQVGPYREDPGQSYGIVGLVMNVAGLLPGGIIFGILSRNKSREAGFPTTLGTIAMVWGIIGTVLAALVIIFWIVIMVVLFAAGAQIPDRESMQHDGSNADYSYLNSSRI